MSNAPHLSPTSKKAFDGFSEAYLVLSKVWHTAYTLVQKGKGGTHLICYKITVIH